MLGILPLCGVPIFYEDYPYQREPPQEKDLFGVYVIMADEVNRDAKIILKPNHTFDIYRMPHRWLWLSSNYGGYDDCYGTWKVEKISGSSVYSVIFSLDRFSNGSAFHHDQGFGSMRSAEADIIAKTKKRPHHRLVFPILDEGGLVFDKEVQD